MLLASLPASRPLHGAVHMGEPTPHSTLIIPADLCSSVPKDVVENGADSTPPPSTRTHGSCNSPANSPQLLEADQPNISRIACALPLTTAAASTDKGDEETCSIDAPSKGPACTATPKSNAQVLVEPNSPETEVAVREEDEGHTKEEDNGSQSQRQGPSSNLSFLATRKSPSPSVLRNSCCRLVKSPQQGRRYRTRRRIRGIWGDDNCSQFSQLHDETLLLIASYLSMKDLCVASLVSQRWKLISLHQDPWKRIDASDFVKASHDHYARTEAASEKALGVQSAAPKSTSLALAARLEQHSPLVLEIRSIQHRLSADNFLSSMPSLQELTLTSFVELTDTHIHVLLLSSSCKNVQAKSMSCALRKLVLENCPRLTNATVQSIGKFCPELEELSLKGNPSISDLSALKHLWYLVKNPNPFKNKTPEHLASPSPFCAMSLLFNAPPTTTTAPTRSPSRQSAPTNSLQSLFAPPGLSPPRSSNSISILPRTISSGSTANEPAKLTRINVSLTGVSPKKILATWATVPPGNCVSLEKLYLGNTSSGGSWNDAILEELAESMDLTKLQALDIRCSLPPTTCITDKGLQSLLMGKDSLCSLKYLNLSGHASLSGIGLAELITAVATTLEELVLDGCKGISCKSSNTAKDFANCDALAKAILNCTTREVNQTKGGRGLRRLSLSRCFSEQSKLQRNIDLQIHEETMGSFLLEAMGPKRKKKKKKQAQASSSCQSTACPLTTTIATLQELDLTDCWFVTSADIAALKKQCPGLYRIHLKGTRADEAR